MAAPNFFSRATSLDYAIRVVETTYGDRVSIWNKGKFLNKFGRNLSVGTSRATVMELQGSELNETFVSTNLIDSISSDAAGDTGITFVLEGHTIDSVGNLTFTVQTVTLDGSDGRTKVALGTPLARATRLYVANSGTFNSPQSAPAGNVYVYDDTGGVALGIPSTAAATKLLLSAGTTQSEKAATSVSYQDYWFVTEMEAAITGGSPTASEVDVRIETRDVANGGVWRPLGGELSLTTPEAPFLSYGFNPPFIVPKNHDVRVTAVADTGTAEVTAELQGYLGVIRG